MAINLSDLPPKYQQQAVEKYMKQQKRRGPAPPAAAVQNTDRAAKYRNTPTERVTASGFSTLTAKKRPGDMTT